MPANGWLPPTENEIAQRIRLGEDQRLELKSVARTQHRVDARDLAKAIAALANTEGGWLILGLENDGTPTGVGNLDQADKLMLQVTQVCDGSISPPISCHVAKAECRGVLLLIVEVPAFSHGRPYSVDGKFYKRYGSRSDAATREDLFRLLESADYHFDKQPVQGAATADLDSDAARTFIAEAYAVEWKDPKAAESPDARERLHREQDEVLRSYLQAMKCIDAAGRATVAGILLFGRDPNAWLPDARITGARFAGATMAGDFVDLKEMRGRLPDQLRQAEAFLDAHVPEPATIEGWDRKPLGVPRSALREALLNALLHCDYRMSSQVRILIFSDRTEFANPGGLLNRLTVDSIRAGMSQRRNPAICSLLNRVRGAEDIGRGIPEMIRAMKDCGLPEPEFDVQGGHFRVVLRGARGAGT